MSIVKINPPQLYTPPNYLDSQIVRAKGNVTYRISGLVALDKDGKNCFEGDMAAQLRWCYEQATIALKTVGFTWNNVFHVYILMTDMEEYMKHGYSAVKDLFGNDPPASTTVEVTKLYDPAWLVEVQLDAVAME